jgi:uncharacterized membrane protein
MPSPERTLSFCLNYCFLYTGISSQASSVSADGTLIVGDSNNALGNREAFIWDSTNGMQSLRDRLVDLGLDLEGWTLTSAQGISADGQVIVGHGKRTLGGASEAWIAIIPEPSTALLLATGLAALAVGRRQRLL